jgi:hypothetical protein
MIEKLVIHSDGTGRGTIVMDENGRQLPNISDMTVSVNYLGHTEAILEVSNVSLNITADLTEVLFICPSCGDSHEHHCTTQLGGTPIEEACEATLTFQDPWKMEICIRGRNHTQKHFSGEHAWE